MIYIECPQPVPYELMDGSVKLLFLTGGIVGCPDWQQDMVGLLEQTDLVLLNPRRAVFPIDDPNAAPAQIEWEYYSLQNVDAISYWFCSETLNPIVLHELGVWSQIKTKPIFVGVHPDYARRVDVEIQMQLARPGLDIMYSVEDLARQVVDWSLDG